MRGVIHKEWLYTKRNARTIALHLISPFVIVALNDFLLRKSGATSESQTANVTVFFAFYAAVSFTTVFRGVQRLRTEVADGSAHLYLLTRMSSDKLLMAKFMFEAVTNLVAVLVLLSVLRLTRGEFVGGMDALHAVVASIALTALTFALSALIHSDDAHRFLTMLLSVTPLIPGVLLLGDRGRLLSWFVPTLTAFEGFRAIAADVAVSPRYPVALATGLVVSVGVSLWAYPRMLAHSLTRPVS